MFFVVFSFGPSCFLNDLQDSHLHRMANRWCIDALWLNRCHTWEVPCTNVPIVDTTFPGGKKQQPLHRCEWTLQRNLTRQLRRRWMTAKGSLDLWNDSATKPTKKGYKDDENHSECFEYFVWDWLRMDWLRSVEGVHFGDGKFYVWVLGVKFTSDMKLSHWSWHWMFHICQDKVIISTDEQITWK